MNKLTGSKTKSHQSIINFRRHHKNNVYPLKPEFRRYINTNIAKKSDRTASTAKSFLISIIVISTWCFGVLLLAKASHKFLQEICLKTVEQIDLNRK